jgi:pimeloyl-ACP methyl ester carboxylesterase
VSVHYVTAGHGPALLLLHGLGGFAEAWRHNIDALAEGSRVFAMDLPGFGRSAKPRTRYGLGFFAEAVHAFLDAVGVERAALIGHSLGGAVAVAAAAARPDRIDRLALVAAVVPGAYRPSLPYRIGALPVVGDLLACVRCAPAYRASIARCFHRPIAAEVDFLVRFAADERLGHDARRAFLATLRHVRQDLVDVPGRRSAVAAADMPVLFVHGRQDRVVPPACCDAAAALFGHAPVRWLDRCGHFPQIEHAKAVNDWLAAFVAGRPAAR